VEASQKKIIDRIEDTTRWCCAPNVDLNLSIKAQVPERGRKSNIADGESLPVRWDSINVRALLLSGYLQRYWRAWN